MELSIRPALPDDAPEIAELYRSALGYELGDDTVYARLYQILPQDGVRVLLAIYDGRVVGFLHACTYEAIYMDEMLVNVMALAVAQDCQRMGVGRALMLEAEAWARKLGAAGIRALFSDSRIGADEFFARLGYTHRKTQENYRKMFDAQPPAPK